LIIWARDRVKYGTVEGIAHPKGEVEARVRPLQISPSYSFPHPLAT
jgi:hypothetical protein